MADRFRLSAAVVGSIRVVVSRTVVGNLGGRTVAAALIALATPPDGTGGDVGASRSVANRFRLPVAIVWPIGAVVARPVMANLGG
jgi:hypothetical protein